ncbi:enoyl-CoA hydratase/isomerase family protein [Tsukamurella sp. 8F]|uniref:enoyl-CoA hydratase/isomerase family protein n=1 Tax=unclassified Tsukamurella TaxID=2633480 RepID=UPI0023B9D8AA|nr:MULTISPECIES: enoyl-CoA hydratase/isomerase family protein [unclassified Tsukamurella]MDF0528972.1 enoyl-CoA hydratase/isomerase family protein [Tsukamurella sp. 8J]MDF0587345.1 enoyl-CoA hydratase/isomerase family protein [Tsukamurella sp. 8F]
MPYLVRDDDVFILYLGDEGVELSATNPENRFTPEWIDAVEAQLDEVEAQAARTPGALVVTATGKFFSNGLDVGHIAAHLDELPQYLDTVHRLYSRLLTMPMTTIAAVNGHAFGAGAMLALSCDAAVMRSDRGFWCLPELGLKMSFTVGMASLLRTRMPYQTAVEAMTTARRYGGPDAQDAGIVAAVAEAGELLHAAVTQARGNAGADGPTLRKIKTALHAPLLADLATPPAPMSFG